MFGSEQFHSTGQSASSFMTSQGPVVHCDAGGCGVVNGLHRVAFTFPAGGGVELPPPPPPFDCGTVTTRAVLAFTMGNVVVTVFVVLGIITGAALAA